MKELEEIKKDISQYSGDMSRSREQTCEDLEELVCDIEIMIDALKN